MLILGLNKTTLLDYPGRVAATLFVGGCNFCCPFCHNRELVYVQEGIDKGLTLPYTEEEVLSFLKKRQNVLTGVCISGGEPTLQKDLPDFLHRIKELGYQIKLDTNGYRPDVLRLLLNQGLIDACAMDIKNSPAKYARTAGLDPCDLNRIKESVSCLLSLPEGFPYEFRTTLVRELHEESDMYAISQWLRGARAYFLQSYTDSENVICSGYHAHTPETLLHFLSICQEWIPNTQLRGVDA